MKTQELVIIDAIKFSSGIRGVADLMRFCGKAASVQNNNGHTWAVLKNPNGRKLRAEIGDWIIKASNGNFGISKMCRVDVMIFA